MARGMSAAGSRGVGGDGGAAVLSPVLASPAIQDKSIETWMLLEYAGAPHTGTTNAAYAEQMFNAA